MISLKPSLCLRFPLEPGVISFLWELLLHLHQGWFIYPSWFPSRFMASSRLYKFLAIQRASSVTIVPISRFATASFRAVKNACLTIHAALPRHHAKEVSLGRAFSVFT